MRVAVVCLLSSAAVLAACSPKGDAMAKGDKPAIANPVAALTAPPKPRVGVWAMDMTMTGPQTMKMSNQVCIDQALVDSNAWAQSDRRQMGGMTCDQTQLPLPGGYAFRSTCKTGEQTIVSEGRATGDFKTGYQMTIDTKTTPAPAEDAGDTKMSVVARYIGPCPAGQAGGVIPGSMKVTSG